MWNPSEKEAKKAFDYASKSSINYNKLNEMGKRAFWQYGRDKGIFNLDALGVNAKGEYSKYVTDDMPYASKNPMERATLARQSEQGQFDDSEQVKASKLQDRRLLNEQRLESLTQAPSQTIQPRLPQTGNIRQQQPTLKHERAKTYEAKESFDPLRATGKLALDTLMLPAVLTQTPVTMGKYGVQEMEKAKAEGKSAIGGLLKGYGTGLAKSIKGEEAAENIELVEGIAPKTTSALKEKYPNAYKAVSTIINLFGVDDLTAIGLLGDIAKVRKLNKGINTTADLMKMSQAGIKDAEKIAKLMQNPDVVRAVDGIPEKELNSLPRAKQYKTLTKEISELPVDSYVDEYLDSIGEYEKMWQNQTKPIEVPIEDTINKVSVKKKAVNQAADIDKDLITKAKKQFGTTSNPIEAGYLLEDGSMLDFSGKRDGGLSNVRYMDHREIQELFDGLGQIESMTKFMDDTGSIRMSVSQDGSVMIDITGNKPLTQKQVEKIKQIASRKKYVAFDYYGDVKSKAPTFGKELEYPTVKDIDNVLQEITANKSLRIGTLKPEFIPSTITRTGTQKIKPTLQPLQPPKLEAIPQRKAIGQTLKPIGDLRKSPVEPQKAIGNVNTLPIENKSLTGAIKASDETLEGTLPKATKTEQTRLYDDIPKGDIAEGMKERGFSRNVRTDEAMPDDIRIDFDDSPLAYKQVGNPETLSKAENIMKNGQSQAMSQYYELLSKNKPESVPLAKLIAKNAEAAGDIDTARRVLADAAEKLTEAGQFSQAAKILRESDPETFLMTVDKQLRKLNEQGLKQYGKKWADIDLLPNEITAIQNIPRGNQQAYEEVWEQIANRISKDLPSTKMEKFDAWRRMAMLLNPKTHIRNTVGNVFMVGMRKTSDTLGAGLEKLFRVKERTKSFGWSQNKDIVSKVEETWNTVKKDILGESRWEIDNIKSLGREKNIFKNKTLQGLNEFSLKTLNAEDNIFTQRAFKDALGQFMQANGLKEANEKAIEYATRRAWESTYKQANKLADWINQAKKTPVVGRLVEAAIPFTKTPANIMKTTFEYSPAGLVKLIFSKGKPPAEVIETLAKGLTGTSITGLGFMLASMGAAKTQNSKSNKVSAIDTEMGEQPYSIITPQGSYTFDWAQPLAVPLAMGIAMYESINNKDELDFEAVMDSIAQGGDSLFNMSMLQNVKQFLGYGSTTENILGLPWNYVQQAWPSLFGQVAKTVDDTKRSTYDPNPQKQTWNRLKSRIPFASKSLEPSLNVWGEEQKQGGIIQQFINPGYTREKSNDPVTIEISRLYAEHGDNDMLPKMAQNFKIEGKTTKLSPGDMTEFQRKMGQENHTEINRLISSAQYQLLSDIEKMKKIKKIVNDNYEEAKEGIIKKMK